MEAALAHRIKDKAEAAYARSDLFEKRLALMESWARHLAVMSVGRMPRQMLGCDADSWSLRRNQAGRSQMALVSPFMEGVKHGPWVK